MTADPEALAMALDFEHRIARRSASTIDDFGWGFAVRSRDRFAISVEHNRLIVTDDADPKEVMNAVDTGFSSASHRQVNWDHDSHLTVAADFKVAGYDASTDLVMALPGPPPSTGQSGGDAHRVSGDQLDPAIEAAWVRAGMTRSDAAVLTSRRRLLEEAVHVEYFAVRDEDEFASHCELRVDSSIAQIDAVMTGPRFQRRGHARRVLTTAIQRASELDCELVFLQTDANEWPQSFYERIGFRPIGQVTAFAI